MPAAQYTALATVTLAGPSSSVIFAGIPSTYRDLMLVMNVGNSGNTGFPATFNYDTNSNYSSLYAAGNGSNYGSSSYGSYSTAFWGANVWSNGALQEVYVVNIFDYAATDKHKTWLSRADSMYSGSNTSMNAGRWASTAAINSIQIKGNSSSNFITGSTLSLYGVK